MLNASYDLRRNPKELLINPESSKAGWKNLGTGLQIAGGILSWKNAKDRAERINKAQEDYYDALNTYLKNKETDVGDSTKSFEDALEDEKLYSQLEDLPEDDSYNRLYNTDEANDKRKKYLEVMDLFLQMYGGK